MPEIGDDSASILAHYGIIMIFIRPTERLISLPASIYFDIHAGWS